MPSTRLAWNAGLRVIEPDRGGGFIVDAIAAQREQERPRTGLHCSTIVNDIVRTLYPQKFKRSFERKATYAYQEIGNVIEDVIGAGLGRRLFDSGSKPEPRTRDGISCSPDWWAEKTRTIDEIKATWVSERDFLDSVKFLTYVYQGLTYAWAWHASRLRFHVVFLNGNYTPPIPNCRTFIVRWDSARVLDAHGDMMVQHAADRGWLKWDGELWRPTGTHETTMNRSSSPSTRSTGTERRQSS